MHVPVVFQWPVRDRRLGTVPAAARQGLNVFGVNAYGGPCAPPGPLHHYHLTAYAVSVADLPGLDDPEVARQVADRILTKLESEGDTLKTAS